MATNIEDINLDFIKRWENAKYKGGDDKAIIPIKGDVWTVGWGHTRGVTEDTVMTEEQNEANLLLDVQEAIDTIHRYVKPEVFDQYNNDQKSAMVSRAMNVGNQMFVRNDGTSTNTGTAIRAGKWDDYAYHALSEEEGFNKKRNESGEYVFIQGLQNRLDAEYAMGNAEQVDPKRNDFLDSITDFFIPEAVAEESPPTPKSSVDVPLPVPAPSQYPEIIRPQLEVAPAAPSGPIFDAQQPALVEPLSAEIPAPDLDVPLTVPAVVSGSPDVIPSEAPAVEPLPEGMPLPPVDPMANRRTPKFSQADALLPEPEGPSAGEVVSAAFTNENSAFALYEYLNRQEFEVDHNFDFEGWIDSDETQERMKRLPLEAWEGIVAAGSAEHGSYLLDNMEKTHANNIILSQAGAGGMGAILLAAVLDPVDIIASLLSGGTAAYYKAGKTAATIAGGVSAAAGGLAAEAVLQNTDPLREDVFVAYAAIGGLMIGAPIGRLIGGQQERIAQLAEQAKFNHTNAILESGGFGSLEGAVRHQLAKRSEEVSANIAGNLDDVPELLGWIPKILTYSGVLHGSKDSVLRKIAFDVLETGLPQKSGVKGFTAEGIANMLHRTQAAEMQRSLLNNMRGWAKDKGYSQTRAVYGTKYGAEFREEVGRAIRGEDTKDISEWAKVAANDAADIFERQLGEMQRAGVKGARDIEFDRNYFPRVYSAEKWRLIRQDIGDSGLEYLFSKAFRDNDWGMPRDISDGLAKALVAKVGRSAFNMDINLSHGIDISDVNALRQWLGDEFHEVADLIDAFNADMKANKNAGKIKNLKRRADFNETAAVSVGRHQQADGTYLTNRNIRISDLLENDIGRVGERYLRVTSGHTGLAHKGIKSVEDQTRILEGIRSRAADKGELADKEVRYMEDVFKLISGHHLENNPDGLGSQLSRSFRAYNFARVGGGFGFAQIAETGMIIGHATFGVFLRTLPSSRKLFKLAADGKLADPLAREMEYLVGAGTDFLRAPAISGFDEFGEGLDGILGKIDPYLQTSGRIAAVTSGMAPINAWLQRIAVRSMGYRMADLARKGGPIKPAALRRFNDAGLDEADVKNIFAQINKHAEFDGKNLSRLNVEKWDEAVLETYQLSMHRTMRRVIQENDIGNSMPFMHQAFGKMVTQFQTFMINAINKMTIHGLHFRDREMVVGWLGSMCFGGLAYTVQTSINFASEPDELKDRLTTENIAKAAFLRAGWSSFMPQVIDAGSNVLPYDKQFSYGRSSGLKTGELLANPTFDLIDKVGKTAVDVLTGNIDQQTVKNGMGTLMFQNVTGVRNAIALLSEGLPKE